MSTNSTLIEDFWAGRVPSFGVAGNFTGHLEQAGEDKDFLLVKAEQGSPKALFPTYIPSHSPSSGAGQDFPQFLSEFPFSSEKIIFPAGEQKVQIEPECALLCDISWSDGLVTSIVPRYFGASNDCSIRREGAKKISLKKNWGAYSKGFSRHAIPIDSFSEDGTINSYFISSFLIRDGKVISYGESSRVRDYSYVYGRLLDWCRDKFNNQRDEGPAEPIGSYLKAALCPEHVLISIGATRYTQFGMTNFLRPGDETAVVVHSSAYKESDVAELLASKSDFGEDISVLRQEVVL